MSVPTRYLDPEALAGLSGMALRARTIVEGFFSGQHRSAFHGASVEFADHREYSPGDELRHIDWKVYGRTDRFFVKEYDAETNLNVHLIVDASASMGQASGRLSKLQYACYLAATLAYIAVQQRDAVGLVVFGDDIRRRLAPSATPSHLNTVLSTLDEVSAEGATNVSGVLRRVSASVARRGLIILISDLYEEAETVTRGLAHFRHQGHDVAVFHVLDPLETQFDVRGPTVFEDVETGQRLKADADDLRRAYLAELERLVREYRQGCRDRFIDYMMVETTTPFEVTLGTFLGRRSLRSQ
ncbi:MAG: DUF58 domain-containing protein [Armatimonadota bacterium]